MNRLLVLTTLVILAVESTGCVCCPPRKSAQCRPCAPVAAPCCTDGGSYATPGIITTAPTLSVPQNYAPAVIPGPAAYVPAP